LSDNRCVHTRFHVPGAERAGDIVDLPHEEAQHLVRVLRLKAGVAVRVFNGRGGEFDAVVETVTKTGARVCVGMERNAQSEARVAVTLAHAILKGDKMDDVVRDAVMMGVAVIQPLVTTRSEVALASLRRGNRQERWQRIAVSSAKQCGRAVVPMVREPRTFDEVLALLDDTGAPGQGLMLVEPSAAADVVSLGELDGKPPRASTILVGPEGGWTPDEISRGANACQCVTLGNRTLRADAMALVAVTALLTHWREL
jgi:16S rRNA (uracil1498-N3)-methyltransferase